MKGLSLKENKEQTELLAEVDPLSIDGNFELTAFADYVKSSDFKHYSLSNEQILELQKLIISATINDDANLIEHCVGIKKPSETTYSISNEDMLVTLTIVNNSSSIPPEFHDILEELQELNIVRGISHKRIKKLLLLALESDPDSEVSDVIAKGLLPRKGRDSVVQALVPNALDRILAPQDAGNNKVNMRQLGDIICVKPKQSVAQRIAPTNGRKGYTVKNKTIDAFPGEWKDIKLGSNTYIAEENENIILANVSGQPKFQEGVMSVDNTLVTAGVNVGTGNITYDGAVIVNGDVTENMKIIAKGDVTVNGFVESAFIRSEGDIIITKGAMGKMHDVDCQLIAQGNIFIQHAQGLDINVGKDLRVAKQLAYSRVDCKGSIFVGTEDNPMGNLFASTINCARAVYAGNIGAISGSALSIDFSNGFNLLNTRIEQMTELFNNVSSTNAEHETKAAIINNMFIPNEIKDKLTLLKNELEAEKLLLNWIKTNLAGLHTQKDEYQKLARVTAHNEMFTGVTIKLNNKIWNSERQRPACAIKIEADNWEYYPID